MPSRQVGVLLLCACLAGCDIDLLIISPGALVVGGGPHLILRPITPFPQTVPFPTCPSVQPAVARFEIVIANDRIDRDLDQIDVTFADERGRAGSKLTFSRREIAEQFGSTLVAAGRDRVIVIVLGVGCGTLTSGTIVVRVRLHDTVGTSHTVIDQLALPGDTNL